MMLPVVIAYLLTVFGLAAFAFWLMLDSFIALMVGMALVLGASACTQIHFMRQRQARRRYPY